MVKKFRECEECGPSKSGRGHVQTYSDGGTYCHRCGHYTKPSIEALIAFALGQPVPDESDEEEWENDYRELVEPARYTALETFRTEDNWYAWPMRTNSGKIIGYHTRNPRSKVFINEGERGLGFVGRTLTSRPSTPLIIVEGPFDVITPRHVCCFGTITGSVFKQLKLQSVWVQPDPDCYNTVQKREDFKLRTKIAADMHGVMLMGWIEADADPDEAVILKHHVL